MFASQLLRILQTLPSDVDHGSCVSDTTEEKFSMKENQDGILSRSNGYKEANSLVSPTKDFLDSDAYGSCKELLSCYTKDRGESWKVPEVYDTVFFDDISRSKNDEIRAEPVEANQNEGFPQIIACRRYRNPFATDSKDMDQQWNAPEYECSMISNFIDEKENGSTVSDAPFTSSCKLFETNTKLYTDKRVKEYELPELIVCYKESNYNIVKDICMAKSEPVVDRILNESWSNAQSCPYVSIPADEDQHSNTSETADMELCSADGSEPSSLEDANSGAETSSTANEEDTTESPAQNGSEPTSPDNVNRVSDADTYLEDLMMIFGSKCIITKWKDTNISENESSAFIMLHPEDSGIQNTQQSKSEGDQSSQQPDQIPFEEAALESQIAVSAADEANNSMPATELSYNSELGTEAIIFDFNSSEPPSTRNTDQGVENFPESSLKSEATMASHTDESCNNLSAASQVHVSNILDRRSNNVHGQSLESQNVANVEDKLSGGLLLDSRGHFCHDGEASFSALGPESGLIICSGRMSYAGSISLRSDSSTTSTGSFAFPILHSEWISSPIRMTPAQSRHFRRHKNWRKGLICCRF